MNRAQKSADAIKRIAQKGVVQWIPTPVRAVVVSTELSGARAFVKRAGEEIADPMSHPVFAGGYKPSVGDWVWGFDMNGGYVILGRVREAGDPDVDTLSAQNTSQGNTIGALTTQGSSQDQRISAEAATNNAQANALQNHSDVLVNHSNRLSDLATRISSLEAFRTRAAGFAEATHYHPQYLTTAEGDARYARK